MLLKQVHASDPVIVVVIIIIKHLYSIILVRIGTPPCSSTTFSSSTEPNCCSSAETKYSNNCVWLAPEPIYTCTRSQAHPLENVYTESCLHTHTHRQIFESCTLANHNRTVMIDDLDGTASIAVNTNKR